MTRFLPIVLILTNMSCDTKASIARTRNLTKNEHDDPKSEIILPHLPPEDYEGPILQGWEPWVDRDMKRYLRPGQDTLRMGRQCRQNVLKEGKLDLIVFVQTAPEHWSRRESIRHTWAHKPNLPPKTKVLFILGAAHLSFDSHTLLEAEVKQRNCDLLGFDFVDSYNNVTLDSVSALKFAVETMGEDAFDFMMIADDDTYVDLKEVHRRLFVDEEPPIDKESHMIWGHKHSVLTPHYPEHKFMRTRDPLSVVLPKHDWTYVPRYFFSGRSYPNYVSGAGYVLPWKAAKCLYYSSLELPYFHINDVFITGFARIKCGPHFKIKDDKEAFNTNDTVGIDFKTSKALLFHHVTSPQMRIIHRVRKIGPSLPV